MVQKKGEFSAERKTQSLLASGVVVGEPMLTQTREGARVE